MRKLSFITILLLFSSKLFSQKVLTAWSQQTIENYTKEMYDAAQKLSSSELLDKNLNDKSWSAVFLTLNASANNFSKDTSYLKLLAEQVTNISEVKLEGTSRLVIWDRIVTGEIIFEGKGLVIENDLFKVAGRANQILQSLTKKNFGNVTINSNQKELDDLKKKWLDFLSNKEVEPFKPIEFKNSKISEITSLVAIDALIISLQDNTQKNFITKKCLKNIYKLDEMPSDKSSPAIFCNPDTYTLMYLKMLFGFKKEDEKSDAKWWLDLWNNKKDKIVWSTEKGNFVIEN